MLSPRYLLFLSAFCQLHVSEVHGFTSLKYYRQFRELSPPIQYAVQTGTEAAKQACQAVFKWDQWNCPETAFTRHHIQPATREQCYADTILVAGIIHSVARACATGNIKECFCDPMADFTYAKNWTFRGCNDDVGFGTDIARDLFGENPQNLDLQSFITQYNFETAGWVLEQSMKKTCRCHGLSGSCSQQTCWKSLPPLKVTAQVLKSKYIKAQRVGYDNGSGVRTPGGNSARFNPQRFYSRVGGIVYLDPSPDYCHKNSFTGSNGTRGRDCVKDQKNSTNAAKRFSCRNLCRSCGWNVRKEHKSVEAKCNCSFTWCCEVNCVPCIKEYDKFVCN